MIEVRALRIYPVKSLHGISLRTARLGVRGLETDRCWMVVDSDYHFITQRYLAEMATIRVTVEEDKLILEHDKAAPLVIDTSVVPNDRSEVRIWKDRAPAFDEGDEASRWLTSVLGRWRGKDLRLVRFPQDYRRPVAKTYLKGEDAHTAFADGYPFLVTAEESLALLNERLVQNGAGPVNMARFRPNIVISGLQPFEENNLDTLTETNGRYRLGIRKPCKRCRITTVDQDTAEITEPKEPLRTLTQLNPFPHLTGAFFGQNATLLSGYGTPISVGDRLDVAQ